MTKTWCVVVFLATAFILGARSGQDEIKQDPIKEYIQVTNVEMMMRVIKDGVTMGGFEKKDFRLLEDGVERPINGFFELRKRMKPQIPEGKKVQEMPGRLFLLFFWASQPQTEITRHLDAFFQSVYQPRDRVILASNTHQFDIQSPEQVQPAQTEFLLKIREEMTKLHMQWDTLHRNLAYEIEYMLSHIRLNKDGGEVQGYLNGFTGKYAEYMREANFLSQNINFSRLKTMADDLRSISAQKWALFFFETSRIPMVNSSDLLAQVEAGVTTDISADILTSWYKGLVTIDMATVTPGNRQNLYEGLRSRFIQADTVFHYLNLSTPTTEEVRNVDENPFLSFKPISSDWESILKSITLGTGGRIGDIETDTKPLLTLFEAEDIAYMLTYVPAEKGRKKRQVEIEFRNKKSEWNQHRLIFGKRIEMGETPAIRIETITHTRRNLHVALSHFYPILTTEGTQAHVHVELQGKSEKAPAITLFSGDLVTMGHLELPLKLPSPGTWDLDITVTDSMTKFQAQRRYQIEQDDMPTIPALTDSPAEQAAPSPALTPLLEKSAIYAERLKMAALRFFCQEKIAERIGTTSSMSRIKKWSYDYQIVLQDGKLDESRSHTKKKKKDQPATLETLYRSHYSFFLPATILAGDRQSAYIYTYIDTETMNKHRTIRISAKPKLARSGLPGGEIWIDEADGSVLQIKLDPTTVPGFRNRYEMAAQKQKAMVITDTHQYFLRFKDMRFPTSTFITETQSFLKIPANIYGYSSNIGYLKKFEPTHYSVHYQYEDYRFFDIDTNEKITGWVEE